MSEKKIRYAVVVSPVCVDPVTHEPEAQVFVFVVENPGRKQGVD